MAMALACAGAAVVTAAPSSARIDPGGCQPLVTYSITPVAMGWYATSLTGLWVRGPKSATLPGGRSWYVSAQMPAWLERSPDKKLIFKKANATFPVALAEWTSGKTNSSHSIAVPRGRVQRIQQYIPARQFTAKKYGPTNVSTCVRGPLLYTVTVIAPVGSVAQRNLLYILA